MALVKDVFAKHSAPDGVILGQMVKFARWPVLMRF